MINIKVFTSTFAGKGFKKPFTTHDVHDATNSKFSVSNWARRLEFSATGENKPYYALEVEVRYTEGNGRTKLLGKFVNGEWQPNPRHIK